MVYQPIRTRFGTLRGRDALEAVSLTLSGATLRLEAILNTHSLEHDALHRCRLEFDGVRSYRVTALDDFQGDLSSSFDEVIGSDWAQSAKHYQVISYHFALEVQCVAGRIRVGDPETL